MQAEEEAAVSIWRSLQSCVDLSGDILSNPNSRVLMPWPSVLDAQYERMEVNDNNCIDVDGREVFGELYHFVIAGRRVRLETINVMGTKGIGKSYRLAALAGLLLKQVC